MRYQGTFDNYSSYPTGTIYKGYTYLLLNNSTLGSVDVAAGNYLVALEDNPDQDDMNWAVIVDYVPEDLSNRNQPNGYAALDDHSAHIVRGPNDLNMLLTNVSNLTRDRRLNVRIPDHDLLLDLTDDTQLSGINTGDETAATIISKIGIASSTTQGVLTVTDWNTFNNKVPPTRTINGKLLNANITLVPSDLSAEASSNKNQPNGYAGLDGTTKINSSQLPTLNTINGSSIVGAGNISVVNSVKSIVHNNITQAISGTGVIDIEPSVTLSNVWIDPASTNVPLGTYFGTPTRTFTNGVTMTYVNANTFRISCPVGLYSLLLHHRLFYVNWAAVTTTARVTILEVESNTSQVYNLSVSIAGGGSYSYRTGVNIFRLSFNRLVTEASSYNISMTLTPAVSIWGGSIGIRIQ